MFEAADFYDGFYRVTTYSKEHETGYDLACEIMKNNVDILKREITDHIDQEIERFRSEIKKIRESQ